MKMDRRYASWIITLSFMVMMAASCDSNKTSGDYSSIVGIYTCQESSAHSGVRQYPVEIDRVKNSEDQYIILNFNNKGENEFLFAQQSNDTLLIDNQAIAELVVNGKGLIGKDFKSIQLSYLTDDGLTILDYYATFSR